MNCAELRYVVFNDATKLSSKIPKPKRQVVTAIEIDRTNSMSKVRNFKRISVKKKKNEMFTYVGR